MHILLLGPTGNLGRRLVPALLAPPYNNRLTILVRSSSRSKLSGIFSPELLSHPALNVVEGDATDLKRLGEIMVEFGIEGVVDVAGTQVKRGEEFLLSKIAKAVTDAAIQVGKDRGKPLRIWITAGLGIMKYPGTKWLIQDFMPNFAIAQHEATRSVVEPIPISSLQWSLLAIAMMYPLDPKSTALIEPLSIPRAHDLITGTGAPPGWRNHWLGRLWIVGPYLNVWRAALQDYSKHYENVAAFLAEDLSLGKEEWVGKKVALKEDWEMKDVQMLDTRIGCV